MNSEINNEVQEAAIEKPICRNPNHPSKGSSIKVEPIRLERDIKNIKKLISDNPRNLAIFTLGINTNLRASDLLRLKICDVLYTKPGEEFTVREKKTKKLRRITMNKTVYEAVQGLLNTMDTSDEDAYLFQSRKGKVSGGMLTTAYLNKLVKDWGRQVNLKCNLGSHSLRKTMGYAHRTRFNTDIPTLMEMYNHSTQKQTLAYLGIQPQEIQSAYLKEI
jgi:integrase